MEQLAFYLFAAVAIATALMVVAQRRAVYSAIALIVCFGSVAGLFFLLGAHFIAAIQVIVYAGAIMVLFLFVVMLIDPESEMVSSNRLRRTSFLALPLAALFGFALFLLLSRFVESEPRSQEISLASKGSIEVVADSLFRQYLLPFEVTSILILVAVLGAMVLAKQTDSSRS